MKKMMCFFQLLSKLILIFKYMIIFNCNSYLSIENLKIILNCAFLCIEKKLNESILIFFKNNFHNQIQI